MRPEAATNPAVDEKSKAKLRIFISYSRRDALQFADQLVAALEAYGYEPVIDRHGIAGAENWRQRLGALILAAETVVFVLSRESARSEVCAWEVEETERHAKRLIPIVAEPLGRSAVPKSLRDLNYIYFYSEPSVPGSGFGSGLAKLVVALNTDLIWVREHTRLAELASRWHARNRAHTLHLRGDELKEAEVWLNKKPREAPDPSDLQLEYVRASRNAENAEIASNESQIRQLRSITGRAFVLPAEYALEKELYDHALRLVAAGVVLANDPNFSLVPELWKPAALAISKAQFGLKLEGHTDRIQSAGFSPDGRRLVTASWDGSARIWQTEGGEEIFTLAHDGPLNSAVFTPDGRRVVTASQDATARVWDADSGREIARLLHSAPVLLASVSPDGRVATASADNTVGLWHPETGQKLASLEGHTDWVRSVSFSPDGQRVVTCSEDRTAAVWDFATGAQVARLGHTAGVVSAAFSPDGLRFLTISTDNTARVWDQSALEIAVLPIQDISDSMPIVAFSKDGRRIIASAGFMVGRAWDAQTGAEIGDTDEPGLWSPTSNFSPDGRHVVTVVDESVARIWHLPQTRLASGLRADLLLAALAGEVGRLTPDEKTRHLLLRHAPIDLRAALEERLARSSPTENAKNAAASNG